METFEVTQKILSLGPTYQVRAPFTEDVLCTIKGKLLSMTPKLTMVEGTEGGEIAFMKANFLKTKFEMSQAGNHVATLQFPLIAFKKGFTLAVGGREIKADGGFFGGSFKAVDASGQPVLQISKELALRDKFSVLYEPSAIPREVALMAAVAIDQKFFENND